MKNRKLSFAVILLAMLFILAACGTDARFAGRWLRWAGEPSKIGTQVYNFRRGGEGTWSDGRIASCDCFDCLMLSTGQDILRDLAEEIFLGSEDRTQERHFHEMPMTWNVSGNRLEIFFDGQLTATTYYFEFEDEDTLIIRGIDWPEGTSSVLTRLDD